MANKKENGDTEASGATKITCGIIMPISEIDGCPKSHWIDVREILTESIEVAGFEPHLVSDAEDVGIIQKRIIQNVYENPIIVCDVSGKNPNVMFELGMRLAFDKPTVIVKDEKTPYSFDTAQIEHLEYPRDLRFNKIVDFKEELAEKIKATHQKAISDPAYTTFLKHFGTFNVARLDTKEVSKDQYILEELRMISKQVSELRTGPTSRTVPSRPRQRKSVCLQKTSIEEANKMADALRPLVKNGIIEIEQTSVGHFHLVVLPPEEQNWNELLSKAREFYKKARLIP